MSDHVTLIGAEEVRRAGSEIDSAAETMRIAANTIAEAHYAHQQFMGEWLTRFEAAVEKLTSAVPQ